MSEKPKKPRKDFPLFPHANGSWCKKIKGKQVSFGPWGKGKTKAEQARLAKAAERKYKQRVKESQAGYEPDDVRLEDICKRFLADKHAMVEAERLSKSRLTGLRNVCRAIQEELGGNRKVVGLTPDDFTHLEAAFARRYPSPRSLRDRIRDARYLFTYARGQQWISQAVEFGMNFRAPGNDKIDAFRHQQQLDRGREYFLPEEIREQLRLVGDSRLRAIILVSVNLAMTSGEVCALQFSHFDAQGWVKCRRPKSGAVRLGKLWPRTLDAIQAYVDGTRIHPMAKYRDHVFTSSRNVAMSEGRLSSQLRRLVRRCGQYREGVGTRGYRKTFATLATRAGDSDAARLMMGHKLGDMMHRHYVTIQEFPRERIQKVADVVENAIFGDG